MKKWLGLQMAVTMVLLSACSGNDNTVKAGDETITKELESAIQSAAGTDIKTSAESNNINWEDMAEIKMVYACLGTLPDGLTAVQDAINEISEVEINTHVDIEYVEMGNYPQQISLMMSSGEALDIMMMGYGSCSFASMQAQGQLLDITDYMKQYGQETLDILGRFVDGTTINGRIYGLSGYRDQSNSVYIAMRKDVLEDLGLLDKAMNMTTIAEYEEILNAVHQSKIWNYLAPMASTGNGVSLFHANLFDIDKPFGKAECYDSLGDNMKMISADADGNVFLTPELDEYRKIYELMKSWYDKGLVYKDSAMTNETGAALVAANTAFSYVCSDTYGSQERQSVLCGMPMICIKVVDMPNTTASSRGFGVCVPTTCKYPEAAVAFINLMYTNKEIMNLLAWGIEGVDYKVVDGEACYIAGNETPAYHMNDFFFCNQFLITPWQGSGADLRDKAEKVMEDFPFSDYMGFTCDTTSVTNEIAAVTNVHEEYRKIIEMGMATHEQYEEYLEKLYNSGVKKIVDCYQEQLTAWIEENNRR